MESLRKRIRNAVDRLRHLNLGKALTRLREQNRERRAVKRRLREDIRERDALREKHQKLFREGEDPDGPRLQRLTDQIQDLTESIRTRQSIRERMTHRIAEVLRPEVRRRRDRYGDLHARVRRFKRRLTAAIRRRRRRERRREQDRVDTGGAWGGSQSVGERVVVDNASDYGVWISSRKRPRDHPLSISNPSSDHNEANTTAYAWDLATFSGANLAHSIARDLGISGYSTGNYNVYYIYRNGVRYRVQILWAVSGHFNHVHVGIRRG